MYRTPPPDDQLPDYIQTPVVYPRQWRRRPATSGDCRRVAIAPDMPWHISNPIYRAPLASLHESQYHDDETPELPIIRRASLFLDQQQVQPVPAEDETISGETPELPIIRRASLFLDQQQAQPAPVEEETIDETIDESEYEVDTAYQRDSRKIMVTQRQRSPIYEPRTPLPDQRTRQRPSRGHLSTQLSRQSHKPAVLITCLFLLAILVIGSIAYYASRAQIQSGASSTSTVLTKSPSSPSLSAPPPANPHELIITPQDSDHPAPPVYATAAYLLDADTGATLYARNPFMHLPMLSTTKLMTAVLAVEQGNPDQVITITPAIAHDVGQLSGDSALFGLKEGETYTLRDLLYGLLLVSGNDTAVAIADTIGGDLPHFVAEMNQRAQQLGLYDTHYMNPHGLLETGQYSSAHDIAILGRYAFSLPLIHQISGTEQYHITQKVYHAEHFLVNGNQFLWWYPGVDAGKTGYDGQYDFVQVVSATRNKHHLIGVTIHTVDWWTDMRDLLNWGFDSFQWISPYDVDFQHPIPFDFLWNYFTGDKKENTIPTSNQGRYYIYTGFSVSGLILSYFDHGGGLIKFGYPESMATISSTLTITQRFEHATIQCDLTTKQCIIV
jgi:D-alanyl-D-alanine carboxypeptidase